MDGAQQCISVTTDLSSCLNRPGARGYRVSSTFGAWRALLRPPGFRQQAAFYLLNHYSTSNSVKGATPTEERAVLNWSLCNRLRCLAAAGLPCFNTDGIGAPFERWSGPPFCTLAGPACLQRHGTGLPPPGFGSHSATAEALLPRPPRRSVWGLLHSGCWAVADDAAAAPAGGRPAPAAAAARSAGRSPALHGEVAAVHQAAAAMAAAMMGAADRLIVVQQRRWQQPQPWVGRRMSSFLM